MICPLESVASEISNLYISVSVTSKETEGKSIDIGKTVETVEKTGNGDGENERGEGQKVQDVIRAEEGTRAAKGAEDEEDDDIIVDAVIQGDCQEYIEPINSAVRAFSKITHYFKYL